VFWLGRKHFAHIPPAGKSFLQEVMSPTGAVLLLRVLGLVLFIAMFWALYDQNSSAWVLQAEKMDLEFLGHIWLASQVQAINPILVLALIPLTSYVIYPQVSKLWLLTPLRKIGIGFALTCLTFLISAYIEMRIGAGDRVNIGWQLFAFAVLTLAEVLVYGTGLEFFYAQAPNRMKSFVMALFLFSVSLGNLFTSLVNVWIQNPDGSSKLSGPSYYLFFAGLMAVTTILYVFYASAYRGQRHVQGVEPVGAAEPG
jgi:POT family proton-dependent oligopeptide transporter